MTEPVRRMTLREALTGGTVLDRLHRAEAAYFAQAWTERGLVPPLCRDPACADRTHGGTRGPRLEASE